MGTLNIAITGAQRLPLRVTADGAPLGMTRNRHGNLTYSLQTQAQRVKLCIETVHELRSPLWFFASLFFFLISVFGIFDVRRPYDRKGRTLRAVFLVDMGGAPEKATKTAFVYAIDAYCKQAGKYTKGESKLTFQDVADCLVLVTNCFSTQTSYENQTKKAITNKFVQDAMTEFFRDRLHVYFIENKQEADRIADQVLVNKRSRESAEKARLNIKKKLTGSLDIANRVQKFVDCRTKDVSKREIYIVEGDSALGSVKLSRDAEFQGIMPVRGKILNCLKADYERIFKSDIITDLIRVLGCGVEVQTKKTKDLSAFDLENLRWNKVIICTDADVDGYQIRTLILTMIYRLCPTLIQEGYVYIAESPLYEITCKDKTWFAYTDAEKTEIVKKLEGRKLSINRSKGLGENDPEMMWMTTMNPATRRLIKVMPEDMERTMQVFDLLLGDNLQGRKDHIAENGYKYLDQLDVS